MVLFLLALAIIGGVGFGIRTTLQRRDSATAPTPTTSSTTLGITPIDDAVAAACTANKQSVTSAVQLYLAQHGSAPQGADDQARIQVLVTQGFLREAPPTDAGYQIRLSPLGAVSADRC
jgi:hypothetical protein